VSEDWYRLSEAEEARVDTPALIVFPERVRRNVDAMLEIAGGPERLRPHVKTHKMAEIVDLQVSRGIERFKCSTIAEAELVASRSARDVLLAHQPVVPKVERLRALTEAFPDVRFSTLVDTPEVLARLADTFSGVDRPLGVFVDLDVGMHRTGVPPGDVALDLYRRAADAPGLEVRGLHPYDGHIRDASPERRRERCEAGYAPVAALAEAIREAGLPAPTIVAGGSITFPLHAERPDVELSPGTTLLWDSGNSQICADLPFLHAAVLATRVVSRPHDGTVCLDLGTKAVASEMSPPRAVFPDLAEPRFVGHYEEHMMLKGPDLPVGRLVYAIPWHICPTVALHSEALVAEGGRVIGRWPIVARARRLTI
jgi:D-serine deaminase-like pyridoxal phosphate-dependent protein